MEICGGVTKMIIKWIETSILAIKRLFDLECFNLLFTLLTVCLSVLTQNNRTLNIYATENNEIILLIDTENIFFDLIFRNNKQLNLFINLLERFNFPIQRISIEQSIFNYVSNKYNNELSNLVVNSIVKQYLIDK